MIDDRQIGDDLKNDWEDELQPIKHWFQAQGWEPSDRTNRNITMPFKNGTEAEISTHDPRIQKSMSGLP